MLNLKKDFPIFAHHPDLVYLDSAATSQKPQVVIDAISNYYQTACANVHRGVHSLSDVSTNVFEESRRKIADFFGAKNDELILVRNATEALNGITYGWADHNVSQGDVILTTLMEHHANIVPWQEATKRTGARLDFINLTKEGEINYDDLDKKIDQYQQKIKAIVVTHVSNTLGTINDISLIREKISQRGLSAKLVVDGAQSAPHLKINFSKLGADFYAFSGHKMLGPMGIGGLLVKENMLKSGEMKPWLFGGGMIDAVYPDHTDFNENLSDRFTAGTPDVASAVGLAAACDYLTNIGLDEIENHNRELVDYALSELSKIDAISLIGPTSKDKRLGSVAFTYKGVHAHDVAQVLDNEHVAVRSGHHCTMPLHLHYNWIATVRASFGVYNSKSDIDKLVEAIDKIKQIFKS